MTDDTLQESLFEDPVGLRFRQARERHRWSVEAVAQQLKLPVAVLEAIEREDWARLGAPIYTRSYLSSYARALGMPLAIVDEVLRDKPMPQLVAPVGSVAPERGFVRRRPVRSWTPALVILVLVAAAIGAWALRQGEWSRWFRGAEAAASDKSAGAFQPRTAAFARFTVSSRGSIPPAAIA